MTASSLLFFVGSLVVVSLGRTLGTDAPAGLIGWLLVLAGIGLTVRRGGVPGRKWSLTCQVVGAVALGIFVGLEVGMLDALNLDEVGLRRATAIAQAMWPLLWLASALPLLAVEWLQVSNPVVLTGRRISNAGFAGLSTALALAMLFPLNYLATENNERWDHSYFKTADPGTATLGIIENLTEPIDVYLFFPHTSDVTEEIRTYFDQLRGDAFTTHFVDQALEGELAKELKVQKNGSVALVRGEGEDQQVQRIRIGVELDKARRKLKTLDQEVHKALLKLVSGTRIAYMTVGHGEMYWKKSAGNPPQRTISDFKRKLRNLNFRVKELGPAQGLATEVPDDANLVIVMGPTDPFLPEELETLNTYREAGGALMVTLDPRNKSDLSAVLTPLGLAYPGDRLLVGDRNVWVPTKRITDRYNIFTNKASTHPSVTTLSRNSRTSALLVPAAAPLTLLDDAPYKVDVTVKSLPEVWLDSEENLRFDDGVEKRSEWPLAAAVSGEGAPAEDGTASEFRVIVMGDATWASDLVMSVSKGNQNLARDSIAWLVDEPAVSGTVNDEKDVKIQHTREGQGWMFYGSAFLVPFGLLLGGLFRIRLRRRRGDS